jgi:hypothetical protein
MATRIWLGLARSIAQVSSVTVTAYDAATTYALKVGGVTLASVIAAGSVNATAAALVAAFNASTHRYRADITAVAPAATITFTATTPGLPFAITVAVTGGTGTFGAVTTPTAAQSAYHWDAADNWSGATLPASGDTVILADSSTPICWGLDQSALDNLTLEVKHSYTGRIGLHRGEFATSANGQTVATDATEYRTTYLRAGCAVLRIGEHDGVGDPNGSNRLKIDNTRAGASVTTVYSTGVAGDDLGQPAVRLKAAHASAVVEVRSARGGVGLASDEPGETATIGTVRVTDLTAVSRVLCGDGLTLTTWTQQGGRNRLQSAAAVTTVTVNGGELQLGGEQAVTTLTVNDGTVYVDNVPAAGAAVTTLNVNGGSVNGMGTTAARTWSTVNLDRGALQYDGAAVTVTTFNDAAGVRTYTAA